MPNVIYNMILIQLLAFKAFTGRVIATFMLLEKIFFGNKKYINLIFKNILH
jgi:hypothetical protein